MLIVGNNLKYLIEQYQMCDKHDCYDNTCISLKLGRDIIKMVPTENVQMLTFGEKIPEECLVKEEISSEGLVIPPRQGVLACSQEKITIPMGYFGLIQTKGSLARLFVTVHQSDGQVDSGYNGNITFELFNFSDFSIKLFKGQKIANLYIFKTSTNNSEPYNGKYQNNVGPSFQIEEK